MSFLNVKRTQHFHNQIITFNNLSDALLCQLKMLYPSSFQYIIEHVFSTFIIYLLPLAFYAVLTCWDIIRRYLQMQCLEMMLIFSEMEKQSTCHAQLTGVKTICQYTTGLIQCNLSYRLDSWSGWMFCSHC